MKNFWNGKRIFLTGHTGFKGAWLSIWLMEFGAKVFGYAKDIPTNPSLFEAASLSKRITSHVLGDIRDLLDLQKAMALASPDIVFHMAAQPLVRRSYQEPIETYAVNIMGTANILEAARHCSSVRAVVNVTSDKCYENNEWLWGYRERDPLGGRDPYSSSKACAELITSAYRSSFFDPSGTQIATARAGNVIGGGDWAADRLVPDFFRALQAREALSVRNPQAIRPWQHVLEPLSGYLLLAESLWQKRSGEFGAWNFGPFDMHLHPVSSILEQMCHRIPNAKWSHAPALEAHEASTLRLDSSQAAAQLNWSPRWTLEQTIDYTVDWYLHFYDAKFDMYSYSVSQIHKYTNTRPE